MSSAAAPVGRARWLVVVLAVFGWGCGPEATPPEPPNLVLLAIDTLRADALGLAGAPDTTPHLDRLAEEGLWFPRHFSNAPWTVPSFPSLFTSTLPAEHRSGIRRGGRDWFEVDDVGERRARSAEFFHPLRDDSVSLAELLQVRGYITQSVVANPIIEEIFGLFRQGFDDVHTFGKFDDEDRGFASAEQVSDFALEWLAAPRDVPFFLVLHYFDPHRPYEPPPEYAERQRPAEPPLPRAHEHHQYLAEVAYMDHHIGRVLAALRAEGTERETVVAVVSDHGEAFGERDDIGHGRTLFDPQVHVPFVLWAPGRVARGRYAGISSNLDVAPTLLHVLGFETPASMHGRNLIPLLASAPPGEAYAEGLATGPELYSLRTEAGTHIWNATAGDSVEPEGPLAVQQRLQELIAERPAIPEIEGESAIEVKGEIREGLRALGYVD